MTSRVSIKSKEKEAKRKNSVKKETKQRKKKNGTKKQKTVPPGVEPGLSARSSNSMTTAPNDTHDLKNYFFHITILCALEVIFNTFEIALLQKCLLNF